MEFALSEEQEMMRESLGRALQEQAGLAHARLVADGVEGAEDPAWRVLAEMGATGILVPERFGGLELSLFDAMLVAEATGRHIASTPFIATSVLSVTALRLFGSEAQQAEWLPGIASGSLRFGVALAEHAAGKRDGAGIVRRGERLDGTALFVLTADAVDYYLVADESSRMHVVPASGPGVVATQLTSVDRTTRLCKLELQGAESCPLACSASTAGLERVIAAGRVMLAAEVIGASDYMFAEALRYARERHQFGRPIGSFQAIKHLFAEMAAALEPARSLLWYAAYVQEKEPARALELAALTKSHVSDVGEFVGRTAVEIHGAMGVTDLLGLHYWFKRIGLNRQLLGGPVLLRRQAAVWQRLLA